MPAQMKRLFIQGLVPLGSLSGFMFGSRSAIIYSRESGSFAGAPHGQPEPPSVSPALNRILRGKRNVAEGRERRLTRGGRSCLFRPVGGGASRLAEAALRHPIVRG